MLHVLLLVVGLVQVIAGKWLGNDVNPCSTKYVCIVQQHSLQDSRHSHPSLLFLFPRDLNPCALNAQDLLAMMEAEDASREDGTSIAGTLVRLAWHASGTYSKVKAVSCFACFCWEGVPTSPAL